MWSKSVVRKWSISDATLSCTWFPHAKPCQRHTLKKRKKKNRTMTMRVEDFLRMAESIRTVMLERLRERDERITALEQRVEFLETVLSTTTSRMCRVEERAGEIEEHI